MNLKEIIQSNLEKKSSRLFEEITSKPENREKMEKLKIHDEDSYKHSLRTCILSLYLGIANGLKQNELKTLGVGSLYHDIGKITVDGEILRKKGKPTDSEMEDIKQHPIASGLILEGLGHEDASIIALNHHNYKKKNSYPGKIKEEHTNPRLEKMRQMVAAADMYDALSSTRCYKKECNKREVWQIMNDEFTGNPRYISQLLDLCN